MTEIVKGKYIKNSIALTWFNFGMIIIFVN